MGCTRAGSVSGQRKLSPPFPLLCQGTIFTPLLSYYQLHFLRYILPPDPSQQPAHPSGAQLPVSMQALCPVGPRGVRSLWASPWGRFPLVASMLPGLVKEASSDPSMIFCKALCKISIAAEIFNKTQADSGA